MINDGFPWFLGGSKEEEKLSDEKDASLRNKKNLIGRRENDYTRAQ